VIEERSGKRGTRLRRWPEDEMRDVQVI